MNYAVIYADFIADRRRNQIAPKAYFERHHILPRCMGGTDDHYNLIDLTPEDHFFAHLLLAKAHREPRLWSAVKIMAEKAGGERSHLTIVRRMYGIAKRTFSEMNSGSGHHMYDHRLFDFVTEDGRSERCTKFDLCAKYGLDIRNLTTLVSSRRKKTLGGWALLSRTQEPGFYWGMPTGENHGNVDKTSRRWRCRDGKAFEGSNGELATVYKVKVSGLYSVTGGKLATSQGWYLADDYAEYPTKLVVSLPKREIVVIKHLDGRRLEGPRPTVTKQAGLNAVEMTWLLQGTTRNAKGWMLPDTDPSTVNIGGIPPLRRSKVYATLVHPEHGVFTGNATEFAAKYYDRSNNAVGAFSTLAKGKTASWYKWRLVSRENAAPEPEFVQSWPD